MGVNYLIRKRRQGMPSFQVGITNFQVALTAPHVGVCITWGSTLPVMIMMARGMQALELGLQFCAETRHGPAATLAAVAGRGQWTRPHVCKTGGQSWTLSSEKSTLDLPKNLFKQFK
jgi:hypothetical protein